MVEEVILNQLSIVSTESFFPTDKSSSNLNWILVFVVVVGFISLLYFAYVDECLKKNIV